MPEKKKRRRYGTYYWIDPVTKLGYAKVQVPTGEKFPNGKAKYKTIKKRADNATHADQLADEIFDDYEKRQKGFLLGSEMTFDDLADWYEINHACPPVYVNGKKKSGMRTYKNVRLRINRLRAFLGKIKINKITEDTVSELKYFIKTECQKELKGKIPKEASVNRYLEDARAMLKTAVRKRWMKENPFDYGEPLIDSGLEESREVTITKEQENVLLHFARKSEKTLIYYVLLCLLDSGARPSEIYDASTVEGEPITWKDFFDYDFNAVKLTSFKGRQKKVRLAPVTSRLKSAMLDLWNSLDLQKAEAKIFPVKSFKTTWRTIRREAALLFAIAEKLKVSVDSLLDENFDKEIIEKTRKEIIKEKNEQSFIETVRLRDLRRNFRTKLAKRGFPNSLTHKILGHSEDSEMGYYYLEADLEAVLQAKALLDEGL